MIKLPEKFKNLIAIDPQLNGEIQIALSSFSPWFMDNKLDFFPEYTDHGVTHINDVLLSAESLISDASWPNLTPEDIFAIVSSIILHDCAMHLNIDGFICLLSKNYPKNNSIYKLNDIPWYILWNEFLSEALRWDGKKLKSLFGSTDAIHKPKLTIENKIYITTKDKMLIGEFLRRHHARLAHEIALNGVPTFDEQTISFNCTNVKLIDTAGLIARSHNMNLREAIDLLPSEQKKRYLKCHIPFIMGILRIADYIQIQDARAPKQLLKIKSLVSPISKIEHQKHISIEDINMTHNDPEALYVLCSPDSTEIYMGLKHLFKDIQKELDSFWAVIGEIYGNHHTLNSFGILIRRIRSNLDDVHKFIQETNPTYVPDIFSFKAADAEMLNLLIKPLYGNNPEIGIRELIQNAVDACREHYDYLLNHDPEKAHEYHKNASVTIQLSMIDDNAKLSIIDNGIGMDLNVLKNYFLNIGASFRNSDSWKKEHLTTNGKSKVYRTGRFGIGVLASFLLGNKITVNTRYINESKGYQFSCEVDDSLIEVIRNDKNIGTTIEILISKEIYEYLKKETKKWDWFCLKWPKVYRSIEDKNIPQKYHVPSANEVLPKEYYQIHSEEFDSIFWTYKLNNDRSYRKDNFSGLICNGIYISDYIRLNMDIANSPSIVVDHPALIIFDQDGRLPLNLQRNALIEKDVSFIDALQESIANYYIDTYTDQFEPIKEQNLLANYDSLRDIYFTNSQNHYDTFWPKFIIKDNAYLPVDLSLLVAAKVKNALIEPVNNRNHSTLWQNFESIADSFIPVLNPDKTLQSRIEFIKNILYNNFNHSRWYSNKHNLHIDGRFLIIKIAEIEELSKKSNFPKTILKFNRTNINYKCIFITN